jgi:uncharacterized lipoprotein YddW (UPF0748 family)
MRTASITTKKIWFIILFILTPAELFTQEFPKIKALWVVRDILKSKVETDKMIAFTEKARITDVFLQVRGRGDAYYTSTLASRAEGLPEDWDPLAYVISKCRPKNIRIHLWLNVFYLWSSEKNPQRTDHLFYRHPDWSAVSQSNQSMMDEGVKTLSNKNIEGIFISPASDEFKEYFIKVLDELISRYTVDGIHLDYVRYAGDEYDYSTAIRSKFMLEYHHDPVEKSGNAWADSVWTAFRRAQVSGFIEELQGWLRQRQPSLKLSAAVWADLNEAENRVLQDWPFWISHVDFLVIMNYAADQNLFEQRIRAARKAVGEEAMKRIVMGISLYNQSIRSAEEKWKAVKTFKVMGISYFSYETIRSNPDYAKKVTELN